MTRACLIAFYLVLLLSARNCEGSAECRMQETSIQIDDSPERTWKSADGKFRQSGKLVEIDGDKIQLLTPANKRLTVPLAKLSASDKKFVKSEQQRVGAANPFGVEADAGAAKEQSNKPPAEQVQVNFANAKPIALQSKNSIDLTADRWKTTQLANEIDPIQIPCSSVHWSVSNCFSSPDKKYLFLSFSDPFGGADGEDAANVENPIEDSDLNDPQAMMRKMQELHRRNMEEARNRALRGGHLGSSLVSRSNKNWLEFYELPSGTQQGKIDLDEDIEISDFDPETKLLLACTDKFSNHARIQLFKLPTDEMVLRNIGLSSGGYGLSGMNSARFLADGKVVVGLRDKIVVLEAGSLRPKFSCLNSDPNWRLANDRRHGMVEQQGRTFEIDLIEGKCVGAVGNLRSSGNMGVASPDGKRTAELAGRTLTIRNRTGGIEDEFYVPVSGATADLNWLDERTLRASSGFQVHWIDVENRVVLMEITQTGQTTSGNRGWNVEKSVQAGGEWFFVISPERTWSEELGELLSLDDCRKMLGLEGDALLLLQPGDRVSVQVDLQADPSIAGEAREKVEQILKNRGVIVDETAKDELKLESAASEEKIEYRRFGSAPWDKGAIETVSVIRLSSALKLVREGKVVWSIGSSTGSPGMILHLNEGETAQQAVDRKNVSPADFWRSLSLPRKIAIHPQGNAWVRYRKSADGYELLQ